MSTSPSANAFSDVWSEPAPIRAVHQEKKLNNRALKAEYQKHLFRCPRNHTKWIRILPNTRNSQFAGQWILAHRVVFLGDIIIIDPEFFTKRVSPFSVFHSRLKRAVDPAIQRRIRSAQNRDGISTWPKDYGIARVIEIPTEQTEPSRISIVHASMNDGTNGNVGYLYAITELAQAVNNDPSLPKERRGMPKYKHSVVDPNHGRIIGLTRTNSYTPTIGDNEDFYTLGQRIQTIAQEEPETVAMATQLGLEQLLYQATEEEAHQLLETTYPTIYPYLFSERITHQSTGLPSEHAKQIRSHSDQLANAVRNLQPAQPESFTQHDTDNRAEDPTGVDTFEERFPETRSKAPGAEPDQLNEDAILNQLLDTGNNNGSGNGPFKVEPAKPYDSKVAMAGEFQKAAHLQINDPAYQTIKARVRASSGLLAQLGPAHLTALKKIVGDQKFSDITGIGLA